MVDNASSLFLWLTESLLLSRGMSCVVITVSDLMAQHRKLDSIGDDPGLEYLIDSIEQLPSDAADKSRPFAFVFNRRRKGNFFSVFLLLTHMLGLAYCSSCSHSFSLTIRNIQVVFLG